MIDTNTSFIFRFKKWYFSTDASLRVIINGFLIYFFLLSPSFIGIVYDLNEFYLKNIAFIITCEIVVMIIIMVPWFFIRMYSFKKMRIINFLIYVFLFFFAGLMLFSLYAVSGMTFDSPGSEDVFSNWIFFIVFTGVPTIIFLGSIIQVFFQEKANETIDHNVRDILKRGCTSFLNKLSKVLPFDIIRSRMTKKMVVITSIFISLIFLIICFVIGSMIAQKINRQEYQEFIMRSYVLRADDAKKNVKSDWQIFNSTLGLSFKHPKTWSCNEQKDPSGVISIECMDIRQYSKYEPDLYSYYHYRKKLNISFLEWASLEDYLKNSQLISYGDTMLGNKKAFEFADLGFGSSYGIATEFNGKILKVLFPDRDKDSIGDDEQYIISSFIFTK